MIDKMGQEIVLQASNSDCLSDHKTSLYPPYNIHFDRLILHE